MSEYDRKTKEMSEWAKQNIGESPTVMPEKFPSIRSAVSGGLTADPEGEALREQAVQDMIAEEAADIPWREKMKRHKASQGEQ